MLHISKSFRPFTISYARGLSSTSRNLKTSLTFFTKETCMLCTNAKNILHDTLKDDALKDKEISLETIDIMKPENSKWFDVYCYDVPVLHVERPNQAKPVKFMHYFYNDKLIDELTK
ncbi:uncharacterized protein AC631_01391 [Debaryomyces fabryi]|uniref:Glutaredoxin-like protein n=1 Tax=Debaryomyces fabryi TaxID=58627 RepID=A0A0V1Q404_9ASCO|nr:uncharacterized protein AC631_01391 [Debaryomyces fabryi]KSA02911.1 hypothetical protein AC631_01391 [Debaryomyces fabryi]CUM57612.1 unnamed protein product [Debaryomyces fabryi]